MNNDFRKKKRYGQNFLTNPAIPKRIAEESGITPEDGVIEIGPGLGILTKELSEKCGKVVAVEIDGELIPLLSERLRGYDNVKVINSDILDIDIPSLISSEFGDMPVCVCANLPYYITTEIIMRLLEGRYGFRTVTVMVQKEVAERFCAKCGSEDYGAVTAVIDYYAEVKKLFTVKAGSFSPKPKIDSAVIRFDIRDSAPVAPTDEKLFFEVIKASFGQRRKTLVNSLFAVFGDRLEKQAIADCISECGFKSDVRGEQLDIAGFAAIADSIEKRKK